MTTSIRNWKKFQHFKDRRPPWIKLYRDLLDDPDWHEMAGDDAKSLVMLWMIASEDDGRLPDIRKLSFRLRITISKTEQLLNRLSNWLIRDDITPMSDGYHDDTPETEGETYREETETDIRAVAKATRPEDEFENFWKVYPKRDGANPKAPARKKFFAIIKSGVPHETILAGVIRYRSQLQAKQQIGTPYVAQAVTWLNQQRWEDEAPAESSRTRVHGPPSPDLPSDEELRRKYGAVNGQPDTRIDADQCDHESNLLGKGNGSRRDLSGGRCSDDHAGLARLRSLGNVFRQTSALDAVGDESAAAEANPVDDGSCTVAGMVRQ